MFDAVISQNNTDKILIKMLDKYRYSWYNKSVKDIVFFAAVVELADTRDLKSRGSNPVPVQVRSAAPRRNGLRSIPIFLCRKISHMLRHSSSFAKRHARLVCSLASALTTAHCRYHLFASVPAAQTPLWFATLTFIIDAKIILLITHIHDFIVKYFAFAQCEIIC